MARQGLSGRLGRIREAQRQVKRADGAVSNNESRAGARIDGSGTGKRKAPEAIAEIPGWVMTAPYLFERKASFVVGEYRDALSPHLPLLFPRERASLQAALGAETAADTASNARRPARNIPSLAFFDLETTGLSHGAGTVAFMAGVARFTESGTLTVTQLLLADYPGEPEFLARFDSLIGPDDALVSYNGKCFDAQILQARYLMNGMRPAFLSPDTLHLDLLFPARRLWKAELGSCRMSDVESGILGFEREDDLPGSEAPDAWFEFLKTGDAGRLCAVGDHNQTDTASLARILFALDAAIDSGAGRAGLVRALDLRSRGEYKRAARFLEPLVAEGDPIASRLLAIDCEHRLGDLEKALKLAQRLGDDLRAARVVKKIAIANGTAE
jgi:uncharacterized protein YprB with RNaseH-like and TPR domain